MKKVLALAIIAVIMVGCFTLLSGCSSSPAPAPNKPAANAPAAAGAKIMKVASVNAKDRALSQGFYKFKQYLDAELPGAFDVQIFTDGVLGDDSRTLEGLQMNTIQASTVSTGPIAAFAPNIAVFDLPFLFKDRATAYKVLDGPLGQAQLDGLQNYGFVGLCYWENGFRQLSNSKRPVTALADIKGLKIRTLESPIHVDIWKALGANPTPMSYSQLYTALEEKVVDGQENPLANIVSSKFLEVQPYVTMTGHIYGASPFILSKTFWNTLNDKEKAAIKKAALLAQKDERDLALQEDVTAAKALEAHKVKISELAPGEKEKMREAVQVIYSKYGAQFGPELMKEILDATK